MLVFSEQHALAFTQQQYLVAERHTGNVRLWLLISCNCAYFVFVEKRCKNENVL